MSNSNGGQSNFVVYPRDSLANFYLPNPYIYPNDTYIYRAPQKGYTYWEIFLNKATYTPGDSFFLFIFKKVHTTVNGLHIISWQQQD